MTGLMQGTLTYCGVSCVDKHAKVGGCKYVQNRFCCIVHAQQHLFYFANLSHKIERNQMLGPIPVLHVSMLDLIRQDACIHNELHLNGGAFVIYAVLCVTAMIWELKC